MDKKFLKNALFGYSKVSVLQYIAAMNEEFYTKHRAEADEFREERARLQNKIDALEAELAVYKQTQSDLAEILTDARYHANRLCAEADRREWVPQSNPLEIYTGTAARFREKSGSSGE